MGADVVYITSQQVGIKRLSSQSTFFVVIGRVAHISPFHSWSPQAFCSCCVLGRILSKPCCNVNMSPEKASLVKEVTSGQLMHVVGDVH